MMRTASLKCSRRRASRTVFDPQIRNFVCCCMLGVFACAGRFRGPQYEL